MSDKVYAFELVSHISLHDVQCKNWFADKDRHLGWQVELDRATGWLSVTHPDGRSLVVPSHVVQTVLIALEKPVEAPAPTLPNVGLPPATDAASEAPKRRGKRA